MGRILIAPRERAAEHQLSDKEFRFITELVYKNTGIVLDERKREMLYRRLMRRTRDLKLASFGDYCALLEQTDSKELPNFINAITTNLTSFFRENHHFEFLKTHFLPEHIKRFGNSKRLRIWSAACSTGEEPYSLAITLQEAMGSLLNSWDVKILATDLDTDVLAKGKAGVYKQERIESIPPAAKKRWFKKGTGGNSDLVKVDPKLGAMITFKPLNLLEPWPMRGPFDVIMCRNVLIYFDKPTQRSLVQRYYELLRPGGLLILGHSESLAKNESRFEIKGRTVFEKPLYPATPPEATA
jgi:chemotaxis protein methyltransferase CheR